MGNCELLRNQSRAELGLSFGTGYYNNLFEIFEIFSNFGNVKLKTSFSFNY
jgi:hypothetical protein